MFMGFQMIMLVVILLTILILLYFVPIGLWIQGIVSLGIGRISIVDLIRMRLRKISPRLVTDGVINLHKAGLNQVTTDMLETHYLAGGNVVNVSVNAGGTSAQGNTMKANQLGKMIGTAIEAELIKQKRPGGILYT